MRLDGPQPVWALWRREKICRARNQTLAVQYAAKIIREGLSKFMKILNQDSRYPGR
jgi:hypothetical protein